MNKIYFFIFASSLFGVLPLGASATTSGCLLEVGGRSYIDGVCEHEPLSDGKGSFRLTGPDGRHFVYVYVDGPEATAHWNGEIGENRAHDPLGALRREGECWMNDTARICVSSEIASAVTNEIPYGKWDCGQVMGFALDASTYTVNGKKVAVANVEQIAEGAFGVTLVDDYRFALFDVGPTSLTWHSPESGDTFECKRK